VKYNYFLGRDRDKLAPVVVEQAKEKKKQRRRANQSAVKKRMGN